MREFSLSPFSGNLRNLRIRMNRAADQPEPNPLREGLATRPVPQPCSIVIFGATGDLAHRKLVPALYNVAADGDLPPAVAILGFARRKKSDEEFRRDLEEATRKFSRQAVRDEIWKTFAQSIFYHQSEFGDESGYKRLAKRLDEIDKDHGTRGNRLFYFAAAPDQFEPILKHLKAAGLNETCKGSWVRVIVEKPFGTDLASARELNTPKARSTATQWPVIARKKTSTQIRKPRLSSPCVCSSTTGDGPTFRFICASGNGFPNRPLKFPFISKKRRRCCLTKICMTSMCSLFGFNRMRESRCGFMPRCLARAFTASL